MRFDALQSFVPIGGNLSMVAAAGVDIRAPLIVDLLGLGVGVVAPDTNSGNPIIGNTTVFGQADAMGVGGLRPELNVTVGTALTAGTGTPTLNVQLQGAIDDGTGNPGSWNTFVESGELAIANLTAGAVIFRCPWVPPFPANLRPRFLSLNFAVPAGTDFATGTIASAIPTLVRDDQFNRFAARNYNISGVA